MFERWRGYRDRTTGASSSSSTRPVRLKDPTRFQSRCSPGCASSSPATPCRTATSTATGHVWRTGVRYSGEPRAPVTPAIHEAHGRLAYQYPYRPWSPEARRPLRWSDLLSRREWHALDLYWEVCRPLDGEYELELWLATPDGIAGGFGFDSFKRDFSERDKLVLDTLQPHLVQLWRNAAARQPESRSLATLTPREREILLWVARGKSNREIAAVLYLAPGTIRKHLDNVYDKLGVSNRAGAVGRAFSIETETFADQSADSR